MEKKTKSQSSTQVEKLPAQESATQVEKIPAQESATQLAESPAGQQGPKHIDLNETYRKVVEEGRERDRLVKNAREYLYADREYLYRHDPANRFLKPDEKSVAVITRINTMLNLGYDFAEILANSPGAKKSLFIKLLRNRYEPSECCYVLPLRDFCYKDYPSRFRRKLRRFMSDCKLDLDHSWRTGLCRHPGFVEDILADIVGSETSASEAKIGYEGWYKIANYLKG